VKIVCPSCERIADIRSFRMEGNTLVLECDRCGAENRLSAAVSGSPPHAAAKGILGGAPPVVPLGPSAEWLEVPPGHCPKCVSPRKENASACGQCGLVFERCRPEDLQPSEWLVANWKKLVASWEEREAHERFVKDALLQQELLGAGRLYRIRLARKPGDALAVHGRDALVRAASNPTQLAQAETDRLPELAQRIQTVAALVFGLVIFGLLAVALHRFLTAGPP